MGVLILVIFLVSWQTVDGGSTDGRKLVEIACKNDFDSSEDFVLIDFEFSQLTIY